MDCYYIFPKKKKIPLPLAARPKSSVRPRYKVSHMQNSLGDISTPSLITYEK